MPLHRFRYAAVVNNLRSLLFARIFRAYDAENTVTDEGRQKCNICYAYRLRLQS